MRKEPPYGATPQTALNRDAKDQIERGRKHLSGGRRAAALEAFRSAAVADPRSYLHPWGLIPQLAAEKRAALPPRMAERVRSWHCGSPPAAVTTLASLSYKPKLARWARQNGFRTARTIAQAATLAELDMDALPGSFVLKPADGAANAGLLVIGDNVDLFSGKPVRPNLRAVAEAKWAADGITDAAVIVEELLLDIDRGGDPMLRVPRDIKVFCVAGQAAFFRIFDRNGPDLHRSRATFDRYGAWIEDPSPEWAEPADRSPPTGTLDIVESAERLSRMFPYLVRFDFYSTDSGPVLGEITTNPNGGHGFIGIIRRALLQRWEAYPDP